MIFFLLKLKNIEMLHHVDDDVMMFVYSLSYS